jgi:hypothetical protein
VNKSRIHALALIAMMPAVSATSCDAGGLAGLLNIFGPSVSIVIENGTAFTAVPKIYTGSGTNLLDDFLNDADQMKNFGVNGTLLPGQSATLQITCEGDTEMIRFAGAEFKETSGHSVGEVFRDNRLRKDNDYHCSDTIRIKLTGATRNFKADVDVEEAPSLPGQGGSNDADDEEDESLADQLDAIFGGD